MNIVTVDSEKPQRNRYMFSQRYILVSSGVFCNGRYETMVHFIVVQLQLIRSDVNDITRTQFSKLSILTGTPYERKSARRVRNRKRIVSRDGKLQPKCTLPNLLLTFFYIGRLNYCYD